MNFDDFQKHGHQQVDWMADYLRNIEQLPVRSQVTRGEILAQIPNHCPERGESMERIFDDFLSVILPGMTHWQHPRFFAYFTANSSPPSILAEMLTATLSAQCMLWETSPSATELETRMMEWLRELIGLPEAFQGSIQDSASTATLCALIAAREQATDGRASRSGLANGAPLTAYASSEAHSSIEKAVRIAGIGSNQLRRVPVDGRGCLDSEALAAMIQDDRRRGFVPACIVACIGTTGIGAVDPISEIAAIARAENVFLHVDAAWAGSALILPEIRDSIGGLEGVDSFVFNPHKWLFTNFDCSAFFLRNPEPLLSAMSLTPVYLESRAGAGAPEYRDWSVPLGRRFRALKLWFVLRSYGAEALREMLRSHLSFACRLAELIRQDPRFELCYGPNFAMLAFRYLGGSAGTATEIDQLNVQLVEKLNNEGLIYLTKTTFQGRTVIRFNIGQTYTTWKHVQEGWDAIQTAADAWPNVS